MLKTKFIIPVILIVILIIILIPKHKIQDNLISDAMELSYNEEINHLVLYETLNNQINRKITANKYKKTLKGKIIMLRATISESDFIINADKITYSNKNIIKLSGNVKTEYD